jgi:hypothetical protein
MRCPNCNKELLIPSHAISNMTNYMNPVLVRAECCGKGMNLRPYMSYHAAKYIGDKTTDDWGDEFDATPPPEKEPIKSLLGQLVTRAGSEKIAGMIKTIVLNQDGTWTLFIDTGSHLSLATRFQPEDLHLVFSKEWDEQTANRMSHLWCSLLPSSISDDYFLNPKKTK